MSTILPTQLVDPNILKPYAGNPRMRTRASIRKIAHAIRKYGFTQAILCDENWVILAGHGRHDAALMLKLDAVPVVRILDLSEADKVGLRLADNRVAQESSWAPELLAVELKSLIDLECDYSVTGFDDIEVDKILAQSVSLVDSDEAPYPTPPPRPVAVSGDIWLLGNHILMCGDATDSWTFARLLRGKLAAMVFTDPPWNVPIAGHVSGNGETTHDEFQMASGEMTLETFQAFLSTVLGYARSFSSEGSLHYVCIDWRSIADLILVGRSMYSKLINVAVWAKPNGGMGSFYRSQHELCAIFKHGDAPHVNNIQLGRLGRSRSNLWQYAGASGFSKSRKQDLADHPTVKPIAMVADAIRDASKPGDLILDPCGGAGTTLLAAEATGRHAALIEIEPKFVDVTLRRFEEQTGIEPLLFPDNVTWSEVRRQRSTLALEEVK
jgi:DNA modification methylase